MLLNAGEHGEQILGGKHNDETVPDGEGSVDEEEVEPVAGGVVLLEVIKDI